MSPNENPDEEAQNEGAAQSGNDLDDPGDRRHWTETHPHREFWTPEQLVIAQGMTQEAYEALYGGPRVAPEEIGPQPGEPGGGSDRVSTDPYPENPGHPEPPRLFTEVAARLGYEPPNERPRDARPIPPEVDLPEDRPPDFWDPREDGGFDEAIIRPGFPDPEELGVEVPREEDPRERDPRRWLEPGPPHGYTPDTIAYYLPWHIGGNDHWGIYFRVPRMARYIERIQREFGPRIMTELIIDQVYWHEMEHFEQELAITALEDLLSQILDPTWRGTRQGTTVRLLNRQTGQETDVEMIQEALATAREVEWAKKLEKEGICPAGYSEFVEWDSRSKSTGYNQFYLCLGGEAKPEARAAFLESVGSVARPSISRPSPQTANRLFGKRTSSRKVVPVYSVLN
jgi:hypothetical protein